MSGKGCRDFKNLFASTKMKKNESQKCRAKIIQGREMKETNVKKGEDL